eukprot:2784623-Rhodomonas_salina.2
MEKTKDDKTGWGSQRPVSVAMNASDGRNMPLRPMTGMKITSTVRPTCTHLQPSASSREVVGTIVAILVVVVVVSRFAQFLISNSWDYSATPVSRERRFHTAWT